MRGVAGAGQGPGAVQDSLEHRREVQAPVDAQAGLGEGGQPLPQRLDLLGQLVCPVYFTPQFGIGRTGRFPPSGASKWRLRYVRDALTRAGYAPTVTGDPEEVSRLMREVAPHLVLLDLVLPGSDGIELMQQIREIADVPVIFLSAYGQDEVVARAFGLGAADYVVKPFSPTELAARIRAALRKRGAPELAEPSRPYVRGGLTIEYPQRRVTVAGRTVALTIIEYRMLVELSANAGRPVTHEHLLQRVWGPDKGPDSAPVRNIVRRLRRKLGDDPDNPGYIFAETSVGYRMEKGEAPGEAADQ